MKPQFTLGAFAIVTDEQNRVLLALRTDKDIWNLPGGGVEHGESPWEAVVREVKEETGLDVEVEEMIGVYAKDYDNDIVFMFKTTVVDGELSLSDEAKDLQYFGKDGLPENTNVRQAERVQDFYKGKFTMKVQSKNE